MDYITELTAIASEHGGIIEAKVAAQRGISKAMLCKVYYIKPELFELGKTMLKTPAGNVVQAYDLERTICDVIRSRNKLGTETFLAALKTYAASPKKNLNKLNTYAKQMRVEKVLRQYLEVLL